MHHTTKGSLLSEFTVSRREALSLLALSGVAATSGRLFAASPANTIHDAIRNVPSLGAIAAEHGLLFGSAFDAGVLTKPEMAEIYAHQSRILTSDSFLKFGNLRPQEGSADFTVADKLVAFAHEHNIPMRGHCLVWNEWTPEWLRQQSASRVEYWMDRHIDEVVSRYAGKLHSWDVVNEPFWPQHKNAEGYRSGPWYAAMGKDYVLKAMKRARAADPTCKFTINESGPEWQDAWGPTEIYRNGILAILNASRDADIRIDAVGLQCHWMPEFVFDAGRFSAFLNDIAEAGSSIYLTELDVSDARMKGSQPRRDAQVAARYALLVGTALQQPKVEVVETWELTDNASWLRGDAKLLGPGGRLPRPLPFDEHYRPKAAFNALANAFRARKRPV